MRVPSSFIPQPWGPSSSPFYVRRWQRDLLYSVICLATGSVLLGGIFFLYSSPFAGVVEISVGAGLVTALLATAISLTRPPNRLEGYIVKI